MSTNVCPRSRSTCLKELHIHGKDEGIKKIIELLLEDAPTTKKFDVIPIVGMDVIGKTTLAHHIYNYDQVEKNFNLKAWVCVSNDFDVLRITKLILKSFTHCSCNSGNLNDVQVQLKYTLQGKKKKFLLVLDDMWDYGYDGWNLLQPPLELEHLEILSDNSCWLIFYQHAFDNRDIMEYPELKSIGKKIVVNTCGGLPLATKALGNLLCRKQEEHEWKETLNNNIWNEESDILPALKLGYLHLPSHLKRCFCYCAIIPKDYKFKEEELVLPSMAEGLIE
ncbi:putative disease resistance protein RGA3 [Camellia sinensis]|uniref:putative disease resistance protein RGA3 n=1 Tax=Camellia sinensis TaxID=4442 RepID=UPI00103610C3|nr:putative disease resistance protein RGA3 [Camellia sinensis]